MEAPPVDDDAEERARSRAKLCALFSLTVGTAIYVAWRFTHLDWLMIAGMHWLAIGLLSVLGGFFHLARSTGPRAGIAALLLLSFPVALLCTVSAIDVSTRIEVIIENASGETLTDVKLTCSGEVIELPDIPPGRGVTRVVRPRGDGDLRLDYTAGPVACGAVVLMGYVSRNGGGYVEATVGPNLLPVTVKTTRPPIHWPLLP